MMGHLDFRPSISEGFFVPKTTSNTIKKTLRMAIAAEKNGHVTASVISSGHKVIVRPRDLPQITGLSRTTIWRLEKAGDFVCKVKLSTGAVGYYLDSILSWLKSREIA